LPLGLLIFFSSQTFTNSACAGQISRSGGISRFRAAPQYTRQLKKAVLSLPAGYERFPILSPLMDALPPYTEIILLMPAAHAPAARNFFARRHPELRLSILDYQAKRAPVKGVPGGVLWPPGTAWAQDLFIAGKVPEGSFGALLPVTYKRFHTFDDKVYEKANGYARLLEPAGGRIIDCPLYFEGGNIVIARNKNGLFAFCGSDNRRQTELIRKALPSVRQAADFDATLKQALGVDHIETVGNPRTKQPALLFHLDLCMIPLKDGLIGLVSPADAGNSEDPEIRSAAIFLSGLKKRIRQLGFRVLPLWTGARDLKTRRSCANAIPFVHAETGQKTILVPSPQTPRGADKTRALFLRNKTSLESVGYRVVPVGSPSTPWRGGPHCLINVLE